MTDTPARSWREYLTVVQKRPCYLACVPMELRDRELCLAAVTQDGCALRWVPMALRDYEMCLAAVTQDGFALWRVPGELRNREICLAAVTQTGIALEFVPAELQDEQMYLAAVKSYHNAITYIIDRSPEIIVAHQQSLCRYNKSRLTAFQHAVIARLARHVCADITEIIFEFVTNSQLLPSFCDAMAYWAPSRHKKYN